MRIAALPPLVEREDEHLWFAGYTHAMTQRGVQKTVKSSPVAYNSEADDLPVEERAVDVFREKYVAQVKEDGDVVRSTSGHGHQKGALLCSRRWFRQRTAYPFGSGAFGRAAGARRGLEADPCRTLWKRA